jgi:hypothetical protein
LTQSLPAEAFCLFISVILNHSKTIQTACYHHHHAYMLAGQVFFRSRDELARSIMSDNLVVGIKGDDLSRSEVSNDFGLNRLRYDL